nr:hypothetical protein [uncultured Anaerobutyricum sp.]
MEYSNTIIISYRTELPKDYLSSSELTKSFSNKPVLKLMGKKYLFRVRVQKILIINGIRVQVHLPHIFLMKKHMY